MALPRSAEAYTAQQRAEIGAAVSASRRIWSRMGDDFDASWASIEQSLLAVLDAAQERVTTGARDYVPALLAETGQRSRGPEYEVDPARLVGTAGDGYPTDSMAYGAVVHARTLVGSGSTATQALQGAGVWLTNAVGTLLSDTGRTAEKMAAGSRQVTGYTRMLNPPSCGRCVILAGKWTRHQTAFERHPGCDCRNIPASESAGGDLVVDARGYLDSLSEADLRKVLGSQANADAYLDGADLNQLINAYRRSGGVRPAQIYSRDVRYTTEGVTRRGMAHRRMQAAGLTRAPRLMPESIYQISQNRAEALRLLRLYGWVA